MNARELGRLAELLRAVRRRLRLAWALDLLQRLAPLLAAVALVLVALGWIGPWVGSVSGEPLAIFIAAGAVVVVVIAALVMRLPERLVARAADRGLRTKDAFATALEMSADVEPFGPRIRERAIAFASAASAKQAVGLPWRPRPVVAAAALLPAIVALAAFTSPQDTERAEQRRAAARIEEAEMTVAAEADELRDDPAAAEAVERLDSLVDELARTEELDEASELLRAAAEELDRAQDAAALAERAATQGLERSVGSEPLPGAQAGTPAAEQFDQLAAGLEEMSAAEQAALAARLDDLAATQETGDPATASALATAAEALREGDTQGAAAALGEAAGTHSEASASAAATAALGEAAAATRRASAALSPSGQSSGASQEEGQGQDQGDGSGQGQGDGGDRGGGGAGRGSAAGASGQVGGASSRGDGAGAPGGQGQIGAGDGNARDEEAPDLATIYDPASGTGGDELAVGGGAGSGEGGTVGSGDGPTRGGEARVPIAEAIGTYAEAATDAMDTQIVAPSTRQLVTHYFNALQNRSEAP